MPARLAAHHRGGGTGGTVEPASGTGGGRQKKAHLAPESASATWRNAGLDGKNRSFLFVKEIKAIPKWNGAKVMRVLEEAQRLGDSGGPKRLKMTSFMYNACISHMATCGRWQEALRVLDIMRAADFPPDEFCVTAAITACGKAGRWRESLDVSDLAGVFLVWYR